MRRRHFRLTLEPGVEGIVKLAQLHQYASELVDGQRVFIGPALREQINTTFPGRKAEAVLDALLGDGLPGWLLEKASEDSPLITIQTQDRGTPYSAIARIIEQVVPEALARPIAYEPDQRDQRFPTSNLLH